MTQSRIENSGRPATPSQAEKADTQAPATQNKAFSRLDRKPPRTAKPAPQPQDAVAHGPSIDDAGKSAFVRGRGNQLSQPTSPTGTVQSVRLAGRSRSTSPASSATARDGSLTRVYDEDDEKSGVHVSEREVYESDSERDDASITSHDERRPVSTTGADVGKKPSTKAERADAVGNVKGTAPTTAVNNAKPPSPLAAKLKRMFPNWKSTAFKVAACVAIGGALLVFGGVCLANPAGGAVAATIILGLILWGGAGFMGYQVGKIFTDAWKRDKQEQQSADDVRNNPQVHVVNETGHEERIGVSPPSGGTTPTASVAPGDADGDFRRAQARRAEEEALDENASHARLEHEREQHAASPVNGRAGKIGADELANAIKNDDDDALPR